MISVFASNCLFRMEINVVAPTFTQALKEPVSVTMDTIATEEVAAKVAQPCVALVRPMVPSIAMNSVYGFISSLSEAF
jgi:hypothetical protein